jgi:hypothetical protein
MSFYRGMTCENVTIKGDKGTPITAYVARPSGHGPFPGVVLVHHLPGWSTGSPRTGYGNVGLFLTLGSHGAEGIRTSDLRSPGTRAPDR